VSFPERRYALAAHLLAGVLEEGGANSAEATGRVGRRFGEQLGAKARRYLGRRPSVQRLLDETARALDGYGFAPQREGDTLRLRNCPFDALAKEHRDLVCGLNLAILDGLIAGLRTPALEASLACEPGMCCVVLRSILADEAQSGGRVRRRNRPTV
jgi:predicted ArsR family transcriptional regulator